MLSRTIAEPAPDPLLSPLASDRGIDDLRFRALLGETKWGLLPAPVRSRFSKRLADGASVVYVGEVVECRMSAAGWLLAQAARLIGAPLPLSRDTGMASVVSVTEESATGGQIWTRLYARRYRFPQVIHSSKRFTGLTGLEERVGGGVGMALRLDVAEGALLFRSDHFFVAWRSVRVRLPAWLSPGVITVSHADLGEGRFLFTLDVNHPWLGTLIRQAAAFREAWS
jgi:Domain of unknown function (DUF4166)